MKVKEIGIFLLIACMALFAACSDDDDKKEDPNLALETVGVYKGALSVVLAEGQPAIESTDVVAVSSSKHNLVDLKLENFTIIIAGAPIPAGNIDLKDLPLKATSSGTTIESNKQEVTLTLLGTEIKVEIATSGTIIDKKLVLNLDITKVAGFDLINVKFNGSKLIGDEKTGAVLTKLEFDSELILIKPIIKEGETNILLYVSETATAEQLKALAFTVEASEKATVTPANGKLDLSTGSATITVVSEDGRTSTIYKVTKVAAVADNFGLDDWVVEFVQPDAAGKDVSYYAPGPVGVWGTTNLGTLMSSQFGGTKEPRINTEKTAKEGEVMSGSAAKIETIDSGGAAVWGMFIPKITPGSLFIGKFDLMKALGVGGFLSATEFGALYEKKPLFLGGHYKYASGAEYFECTDPAKPHETVKKDGVKDKCVINAVLYDISTDASFITGLDTYTNDRIVAKAMFTGEDVEAFTRFDVAFEYVAGKTYDKTKTYRLAIIASSSNEGDKFSGAPGSVLFVDDLEVISE